jgi:hypothetical protein
MLLNEKTINSHVFDSMHFSERSARSAPTVGLTSEHVFKHELRQVAKSSRPIHRSDASHVHQLIGCTEVGIPIPDR